MVDAYDAALEELSEDLSDELGWDVVVEEHMVDAFDDVGEHVTYEYREGTTPEFDGGVVRPRHGKHSLRSIATAYHSTLNREAPDPSTEEAVAYLAALGVNLGRSAFPDDPAEPVLTSHHNLTWKAAKYIAMQHRTETEGAVASIQDRWDAFWGNWIDDRDVYGIPYYEDIKVDFENPGRSNVMMDTLKEGLITGAEMNRRADRSVSRVHESQFEQWIPKATYRADVTKAGQVNIPAEERTAEYGTDIEPGEPYHVHCFPPSLEDEHIAFDATVTADHYLTVPKELRVEHDIRHKDTVAIHLYTLSEPAARISA